MTSSKLKPQRSRGSRKPSRALVPVDPSVIEALNTLWAEARKDRDPRWSPSQRAQSVIYRAHVAALRHPKPKRAARAPQPWAPKLSNRESERLSQLSRIAARKAQKRAAA